MYTNFFFFIRNGLHSWNTNYYCLLTWEKKRITAGKIQYSSSDERSIYSAYLKYPNTRENLTGIRHFLDAPIT
jgi:hypothetical protein